MDATALRPEAEVLLVEDNPADSLLLTSLFARKKRPVRFSVVEDGEQALDFLFRRGSYRDAPVPELIILDLNIPRIDGLEVLREVKADSQLRVLPVVVLTSSESERDIRTSYEFGANAVLNKASNIAQAMEIIRLIEDFWIGNVRTVAPVDRS